MTLDVDASTYTGGSLLIAWQLKHKRVLIVGGGDVASGRLEHVLVADAFVTLISPRSGLHPLTERLLLALPDRITYHDRLFSGPDDLQDVDMVLTAVDDVDASRAVAELCRAHRIPVNVADDPPACDFYFGSQIRDGALQVLISTNGQSPKLANILRKRIEGAHPQEAGAAIDRVGVLRQRLRERAPGVGGPLGKRRMRWMIDVCTTWEMEDLARLDDGVITKLLDEGWEHDRVPAPVELGAQPRKQQQPKSSSHPSWREQSVALPATLGFAAGAAATFAAYWYGHKRQF
jgi:precorrin-2 dehydrogenase/sirohydrochlorin ferrochelatase